MRSVWCETGLDVAHEIYCGITLDRDRRRMVLILSGAGGMDIEQVAETQPEMIAKLWPDPFRGPQAYEIRQLAFTALRAVVVALDPPHEVATANEGEGPAVRTTLRCEPDGGGTRVTLTSEVTGALVAGATAAGLLDRLLFGRSQRRAARATLRRLRELARSR